MRAIVFGGYGVFGRQVSLGLRDAGITVTIAGRNESNARAWARELAGEATPAQTRRADVSDLQSCLAALEGAKVCVNCSGPFGKAHSQIIEACLQSGVHYVDIADDRQWCRQVAEHSTRFAENNLTLAWGCSSFPGISGALAFALAEGATVAPRRVRCSLFIGNRNPKGMAAIKSAVKMIGAPIDAPQGSLRGWSDFETVEFPPPFGARKLLNADAPDYDVMARLLGASHVTVKAGFELPISNLVFRVMASFGPIWGGMSARLLWLAGRPLGWMGRSGGAIMVELFYDEHTRTGHACGAEGAQRLAAWPAVLVSRALCEGKNIKRGAVTAYEALGARNLLAGIQDAGFAVQLG
jgi:hypothetical protein